MELNFLSYHNWHYKIIYKHNQIKLGWSGRFDLTNELSLPEQPQSPVRVRLMVIEPWY